MSYSLWYFPPSAPLFESGRIVCYDSEFVRERHYYPKLALVQLFQPDWQQVCLFDPTKYPAHELWQRLAVHDAPLVLHAAAQDLELLLLEGGSLPRSIRDTQTGFALCSPYKNISYADLVWHFLAIRLPKDETRSDWLARPLSRAQCDYAADDVGLLARIYPLLTAELSALGRLSWWQEESVRSLQEALQPSVPLTWFKLRGAPQQLRAADYNSAQALVDIREAVAAEYDRPRRKILSDEALIALAKRHPQSALDLAELMPNNHIFFRHADGLERFERIFAYYREHPAPYPERTSRLNAKARTRFDKLDKHIRLVAHDLGISKEMLATPRQMRDWLTGVPDTALSSGWRAQFFNDFRG